MGNCLILGNGRPWAFVALVAMSVNLEKIVIGRTGLENRVRADR